MTFLGATLKETLLYFHPMLQYVSIIFLAQRQFIGIRALGFTAKSKIRLHPAHTYGF